MGLSRIPLPTVLCVPERHCDSLPAVVGHWCRRWPFQRAGQLKSQLWCHTWRNEAADEWFQTHGIGYWSGQKTVVAQKCRGGEIVVLKKKYVYSIYHMIAQTLALLTRILPNFPSNEGFDVQIYWYIFRGDNGDSDTAWQVLGTGVNNVALSLKYPLCEDEHCTDNGFWRGQRRDLGFTWSLPCLKSLS